MEDKKITNEEENPEVIEEPITKKDPRRVEQGKRLAAISREAKEKKMRQKILDEMESKKPKYNYYWWGFGGISFFMFLYLIYGGRKKEDEIIYPVTIIKSPEKKFENFD